MFKKLTLNQLPKKNKKILILNNNKSSPICQIAKYHDNEQQSCIFVQQDGDFLYIDYEKLSNFAWIEIDQLIEKVENFLLDEQEDKQVDE